MFKMIDDNWIVLENSITKPTPHLSLFQFCWLKSFEIILVSLCEKTKDYFLEIYLLLDKVEKMI